MFVDDEPAVLRSLGSLFRRDRARWDMVFAHGGPQALRELDDAPFDVVVTDLHMPEVDGIGVIKAVLASSPRTTRIMLSGGAEPSAVLRVLPLVHQFFAKPCDIRAMRAALERATSEPRDLSIADRLGGLRCLPSPRVRCAELRRLAADPDATLEQMVELVERDPSLAATVLHAAGSTYFVGGNSTIACAVETLGVDVMRELATSQMIREPTGLCARVLEELAERAVRAAGLARRGAPEGHGEAAYIATLLDAIGQIVLADLLEDAYAPVLDRVTRTGERLADVEAELLGITHETASARLRAMWALP